MPALSDLFHQIEQARGQSVNICLWNQDSKAHWLASTGILDGATVSWLPSIQDEQRASQYLACIHGMSTAAFC